jgi:hypothetical protein
MWVHAEGGGFGLFEAVSAEVVLEGAAPWVGAYLDFDVLPLSI